MALSIDGGHTKVSAINFSADGSPQVFPHVGSAGFDGLHNFEGPGPLGTNPRGVLILMSQSDTATDGLTSVSVGPAAIGPFIAIPRIRFIGFDGVVDDGSVHAYFLGVGVPSGTLWVQVAGTGNIGRTCTIYTFNATTNTAVAASGTLAGNIQDPQIAVTTTDLAIRFSVLYSGAETFASMVRLSGITNSWQQDYGSDMVMVDYQTIASTGSFTMGYTGPGFVASVAMIALAIRENISATPIDADPSSLGAESATFQAQKNAIARTRAFSAKALITECQNAYAQGVQQWLQHTDEFDDASWTKSGGTTVDTDVFIGPDNVLVATGDRLNFAAEADDVLQTTTGNVVTSKTYTGSVWLFSNVGNGTVELILQNAGNTESVTLVCNVTANWQRFSIQKQFSATPVDACVLRIRRGTGGITEVAAWRPNLTQNLANNNLLNLLPTTRRIAESVDSVTVMAGRCQAADAGVGKRCYYSAPTCQDAANFNIGNAYEATDALRGFRIYRFSSCDAPLPVGGENFLPMIERASFAGQEIYPDKSVTVQSDVRLQLLDDTPRDNWNLVQAQLGYLTNTGVPSGSFLRRFRTIYRNFANPRNRMILYEAFPAAGSALADMAIRGTYLMDSMKIDRNIMTIQLVDPLKLLQTKAPAKISDSNVSLQALTSGATTLKVKDVTQCTGLPDASSPYQYPLVLQLDYDGTPEYVNVVAIDTTTNTFTIQRGRWGTTGVVHPYGFKWREALMLGTENTTPASAARGKNPFDCILELLHRGYGNLNSVAVATLEAERDLFLPGGVRSNQNFGTVFQRAGGTVGTANAAIVDPTDIDVLLKSIRESAQIELWINKDQIITGRKCGPLRPTVVLPELTDEGGMTAGAPPEVDENEGTRFSRITVAFGLRTDKEGTNIGDYLNYITVVNADAERPGFDGEDRTKYILSPWILANDTTTATTLALQVMARYHQPIRKIKLNVELRNDYLQVGTTVALTTDEIQAPDGSSATRRQFFILRREPSTEDNKVALLLQDETILRAFGWISSDAVVQFDSASEAQKRYAFIADEFGLVGTTSRAPGYYVWPV